MTSTALSKAPPQSQVDIKTITGTTPIQPSVGAPTKPWDPLSTTPSSPSMIYLNLLVLEASLRAQYLELRARRRHHTFFLLLLSAWVVGFGYALFFAPREDGIGVGGSVYWGVEAAEKVCFMGGVITSILVWATGIWDRGIRWPRRWFNVSNRGLRGFNCKLVVIKRSWWAELASTVGFFLTYGLFSHTASSSYRFTDISILREVEKELTLSDNHLTVHHINVPISPIPPHEDRGHEEDLAPGGDFVKLLLHAKPFSPAFRENWEIYRAEYWEKENERRALIREKLRARNTEYARNRWGVFWWLPWHRAQTERHFSKQVSRTIHGNGHTSGTPGTANTPTGKGLTHHRSRSIRRGSMSSTRSLTPTHDGGEDGVLERNRRGSMSEKRRSKRLSVSSGVGIGVSGLAGSAGGRKRGEQPQPSPLARREVLVRDKEEEEGEEERRRRKGGSKV